MGLSPLITTAHRLPPTPTTPVDAPKLLPTPRNTHQPLPAAFNCTLILDIQVPTFKEQTSWFWLVLVRSGLFLSVKFERVKGGKNVRNSL